MKKIMSVRLDEWLSDEVVRIAKAQGLTPSMLVRQLVEQGVNSQNVLADFMSSEADRVEKLLKRIETAVVGHMYFATVPSPQAGLGEFNKALGVGRQIVEKMNQIEAKEG